MHQDLQVQILQSIVAIKIVFPSYLTLILKLLEKMDQKLLKSLIRHSKWRKYFKNKADYFLIFKFFPIGKFWIFQRAVVRGKGKYVKLYRMCCLAAIPSSYSLKKMYTVQNFDWNFLLLFLDFHDHDHHSHILMHL